MSWSRLVLVAGLAALLSTGSAWAQSAPDPAPAPSGGSDAGATLAQAPAAPAVAAPEPDRPFASLVPNLGRDLRRLPSLGTAVVLGIGGALSVAASNNDAHFTSHAAAGGPDQIFVVGGHLGHGLLHGGIAFSTYALGRLTDKPAVTHLGTDLIRGQLLTTLLTQSIKVAVRRDRPADIDTGHVGRHSFPSGHSAAAWTTSTVLWRHLGWKAGVPASLLAAYVSASRLQENQHYMSDVLFGAALGVASARTVTFGHGRRRLSVTPAPVRGGGAVVFSVLPD